jgi:hypothetical protein
MVNGVALWASYIVARKLDVVSDILFYMYFVSVLAQMS